MLILANSMMNTASSEFRGKFFRVKRCNDSGYRTIKYDEQLGVDCLLVRDRLAIQDP